MKHVKHLVIYWLDKGHNPTEIHRKCTAHFPDCTPSYSSVTNWVRALERGEDILTRKEWIRKSPDERIDELILQALEDQPFHSVRTLSATIKTHTATVWRHLKSIGLVVKHLRFVPHMLIEDHKVMLYTYAKELLFILEDAKHRSWTFFITGDESWFYFTIDYETQWTFPNEKPESRPKKIISSPKRMISVLWSPIGFSVVKMLPQGTTFTADYFINTILKEIINTHPQVVRNEPQRKFIVHMDNATPHRAKVTTKFGLQNRLNFVRHPPYSPDLAPSDFYLFGKVKCSLKGSSFKSEDELFCNSRNFD